MSHFDTYYARQAFGGSLPVFSGTSLQRGHGIGNILSSAFRTMVPVLKSAGKAVAKQGLDTGMSILGDVVSGANIKTATKRRLRQGGSQLMKRAKTQLFSHLPPPPPPPSTPHKRKKKNKRVGVFKSGGQSSSRRQTAKRSKRKKKRDIFD